MHSKFSTLDEMTDQSKEWDDLVHAGKALPTGVGPMCMFETTCLAKSVLNPGTEAQVAVVSDGSKLLAGIPFVRDFNRWLGLRWVSFSCIFNSYPGRAGFVTAAGDSTASDLLSQFVFSKAANWDVLNITLVQNSNTEKSVLSAARRRGVRSLVDDTYDIPYIAFPATWELYRDSLAKKFRYTIRSSEKQLKTLGELSLRKYADESEVSAFLKAVFEIERESWKEKAGTSLTMQNVQREFHERLASIASSNGSLRGYVLCLDDSPIAFIYGLQIGDVFCDLKESFVERYSKYSPGTVLKALVMQNVIGEEVSYWDFIGRAEFHKLRWTQSVYTQNQYTFYSGWKGRLLYWKRRLAARSHDLGFGERARDVLGRPED